MALSTVGNIDFYSNYFAGSIPNASDRVVGCVDELITAKTVFTFDSPITGVRLKWGLQKNSSSLPSTGSIPDSVFQHLDLDSPQSYQNLVLTPSATVDLDLNNNTINFREGESCTATLSADSLTLTITHTFYIQGRVKSDYLSLSKEIDASLNTNYAGSESVKYIYSLDYFEGGSFDTPSGNSDSITLATVDYFKNGNVGFYNEKFNGNVTPYKLTSFDALGNKILL